LIDFGSGKGRAFLLASEYPFKRIIGIEFAPELHLAAQQNIQKYSLRHAMCGPVESVCTDFLDFPLPDEPTVFFFFDPCEDAVLIKLLRNIRDSLAQHPRPAYLVYVGPTPSKKVWLDSVGWLTQFSQVTEFRFCVYRADECGIDS
jgi:Methyltransferase domain